jgi:hypothetical protein
MKFLPITFCALMLAGTTMFAQQQQPPSNQNDKKMETLTGCLSKSDTNGEYVISDQSSGQKYTFMGPQRLDNYINHTVQLTGTMDNDQNGQKQFKPQSIKTVSNSCQGGGGY